MNRHLIALMIALLALPFLNANAADIPRLINFQGSVNDAQGVPVNGDGYFKFAIVNAIGDTAYWANDASTLDGTEPSTSVVIPVSDGLFTVKLGNTNLANMAALTDSAFDNTTVHLRVWFSYDSANFELFTPDTQIASAGFAFKSQSVGYDGLKNATNAYMAYKPNDTACTDNQIMTWDATNTRWICGDNDSGSVSWNQITDVPVGLDDGDSWTQSGSNIYYSTGNLGIGTINPAAQLDVNWDAENNINPIGIFQTTGLNSAAAIRFENADNNNFNLGITANGEFAIGGADLNISQNSDYLRITNTGNVGIGTVAPTSKLHVYGGNRAITGIATEGTNAIRPFGVSASIETNAVTTTGGGFKTTLTTSKTPNMPYIFGAQFSINDDEDKNVRGLTIDISGEENNDYGIEVIVDDPGYAIHSQGSGKVYFEGNVGIGTNIPTHPLHIQKLDSNASSYIAMFENTSTTSVADGILIRTGPITNPGSSNGFIRFENGGGTYIGGVRGDGTGGVAYATTSDARLKTNITAFRDGLEIITRMNVKKYEFISAPGKELVGFLAQELQTVFPQAVSGNSEGDVEQEPMAIDYGKITPVLASAIQELAIENMTLKAEIRAIKDAIGLL